MIQDDREDVTWKKTAQFYVPTDEGSHIKIEVYFLAPNWQVDFYVGFSSTYPQKVKKFLTFREAMDHATSCAIAQFIDYEEPNGTK